MDQTRRNFEDTDEYKLGRKGELLVKHLLEVEGKFVIDTASVEREGGRGPSAYSNFENLCRVRLVLPDIMTIASGEQRWIEVKTKRKSDKTRMTGVFEHGIGRRLWKDYNSIQNESGIAVFLFIYDLEQKAVIVQCVNRLAKSIRYYYGDKMDPGGMAFFPFDCFSLWAKEQIDGSWKLYRPTLDWIDPLSKDELPSKKTLSDQSEKQLPQSSWKIFNQEIVSKRNWLRWLIDSGLIDEVKPFHLREAHRVVNPVRFAKWLLPYLEGPNTTRSRNGAAQEDLIDTYRILTDEQGVPGLRSARNG